MAEKNGLPEAKRNFAVSRSLSALASHCRTNSSFTCSGGLIDHFPIFVGRKGDAPDDPFAFIKTLRVHDYDVERITQTTQSPPDPHAFPAGIIGCGFQKQQGNIAVS